MGVEIADDFILPEVETLPAPSDPMAVARVLLLDYEHDQCRTLRSWRTGS